MTEEQPHGASADPRLTQEAVPWISGVRLSPGEPVELINICKAGVLVEGRTRLVPGTALAVVIESSTSPMRIKSKVVRCQVSSIKDGVLRYHSGIEFEQHLEKLESTLPAPASPPPPSAPAPAPPAAVAPAQAQQAPQMPAPEPPPRRVANRW